MKRTHRLHTDGKLGNLVNVLSLLQFIQIGFPPLIVMFAVHNVIVDQTGNNDEMFQKLAKVKKKNNENIISQPHF